MLISLLDQSEEPRRVEKDSSSPTVGWAPPLPRSSVMAVCDGWSSQVEVVFRGRWFSRNGLPVVMGLKKYPEIIHLRYRCSAVTSRQSASIEVIRKVRMPTKGLAQERCPFGS